MSLTLNFSHTVQYDVGQPGITLEIALKLADADVSVSAKVDTGSTDCIFSRAVGEKLGLTIEDGRLGYIGTATGRFPAYLHGITLSVLDYDFDVYAYFAADENFSRNVVGRLGFLDRVVLGLIDYEGKLYLNRYDLFDFE